MLSVSPKPSKKSGNSLVFESDETAAGDLPSVRVHYKNSDAPLVASSYMKTVEISHASARLIVQEDYEVHHVGPS